LVLHNWLMKKYFKIFFFLCITLSDLTALAGNQDSVVAEKVISIRTFDQEKLNRLKNDSEFDYRAKQVEMESIWAKIQRLLNQYIGWIFRKLFNMNVPDISYWIFIVVIAVFIIVLIIKLMDINLKDSLFTPGDSGNLEYKVENENIHDLDFNHLIDESIRRSEYRTAIRYLYLFSLQKLSDHHLIDWVPGKTNREYELELQEKSVGIYFTQLGYYFEYAWYGEFELNSENFQNALKIFQVLDKALAK
jgi:hypothetical protein